MKKALTSNWDKIIADQAASAPLIDAAALASELFGDDELERWAAELHDTAVGVIKEDE